MNMNRPPLRPSSFIGLPFDPWPTVLPKTSDDPVMPLVGIVDDLALRLPEEKWPRLRQALGVYCSSRRYRMMLATDRAMGFDVDGRAVEPVAEGAQIVAAIRLLESAMPQAQPEMKARVTPVAEKLIALAPDRARGVTGGHNAVAPSRTSAKEAPKNLLHAPPAIQAPPAPQMAVLEAPSVSQPPVRRERYGGRPILRLNLSAKA